MNPQELKAQCEKLWNSREVLAGANRVIFYEDNEKLAAKPGELVKVSPGKETLAFIRKCTKHYGAPALPENREVGKLKPPKWLVENYKRNCPRNWKALVEGYGQTRTKYDAPLPGEVWRKGKPIGINLEQTEYRRGWSIPFEPGDESAGRRWFTPEPIERDYRGQYYTLTDWSRFKRRAERAKERQAIGIARSPEMIVQRLYSQLRDWSTSEASATLPK
jgi:hypothetical protein